jgi:type IV pilus assembly protein PilC
VSAYAYLCLDARGAEMRGQMEAPDESAARRQLREQGLKVLTLVQGELGGDGVWAAIKGFFRWMSSQRSFSNGDRVLFFSQMQLMLKSGHTLLESLSAASRLTRSVRLANTLDRIAVRIQRGSSMSVACESEKELFDRLALKLIEAGEASGELGAVFERLAAMIERRADVRRQILTVSIYPMILVVASAGIIYFLVASVIPKFMSFLAARGKALPWAASTLMDVSDWLAVWGGPLGLTVVAAVMAIPLGRRFPPAKKVIDRVALYLPLLGSTIVLAAMTQATWVFGVLIRSRLTVLESLRTCEQISGNATYASAFAGAADDVLSGRTLAAALDRPILPRLVQHMAAVGEKSGQLDTVMETLGGYYQKALDNRVRLLSEMIVPVLVLVVGSIVGFTYFAFFQAMLSVSTGGA